MERAFWFTRWQEGRIGFHEGQPNAFLIKHGEWLARCRRILVPLCGKAEDLAYLASRGHEVVGIELVEDAVRQFFTEHQMTPEVTTAGGCVIYSAGSITVIAGDFFAATAASFGPVDGIFDRAALVALPREMRARYVAHLRELAPGAERMLLVGFEFPSAGEGPPFSVEETEVRELLAGDDVQLVETAPDPRGRYGGKAIERCYTIALRPA